LRIRDILFAPQTAKQFWIKSK